MQNVRWSVDGDELTIKVDIRKRFGVSRTGQSFVVASTGGVFVPIDDDTGFRLYVGRQRTPAKTGQSQAKSRTDKRVPLTEEQLADLIQPGSQLLIGHAVFELAHRRSCGAPSARRLIGLALGNLLDDSLQLDESRAGEHVTVTRRGRAIVLTRTAQQPAQDAHTGE